MPSVEVSKTQGEGNGSIYPGVFSLCRAVQQGATKHCAAPSREEQRTGKINYPKVSALVSPGYLSVYMDQPDASSLWI